MENEYGKTNSQKAEIPCKIKAFSALFYLFSFAVFSVEMSILLISRQSSSKELPSLSVMYSDKIKSLNQYSVSAVSFKDI